MKNSDGKYPTFTRVCPVCGYEYEVGYDQNVGQPGIRYIGLDCPECQDQREAWREAVEK